MMSEFVMAHVFPEWLPKSDIPFTVHGCVCNEVLWRIRTTIKLLLTIKKRLHYGKRWIIEFKAHRADWRQENQGEKASNLLNKIW